MKRMVLESFFLILVLTGLLLVGFVSAEGEIKQKYNQIYEENFACVKQCPEDNDGSINEDCWIKCTKISEDRLIVEIIPYTLKKENPGEYLEGIISKKNLEMGQCINDCSNPYPQADYECIQSCFDEKEDSCNGCFIDNKCFSFGYRMDKKFCSSNGEFIAQFNKEGLCENNFECGSNVCISGKCVSSSLIEKILNWFRKLFGK